MIIAAETTGFSMSRQIFYQPDQGWVGDVIPFTRDGEIMLFYLDEQRKGSQVGMGWRLVGTRDLQNYRDYGLALHNGSNEDKDFNAYTGSVVEDTDGTTHLFYTGVNPGIRNQRNQPIQWVMHAISNGSLTDWDKIPADAFCATEGYDTSDWRDPFVFFNESDQLWHMLIAARHESGPSRRRGLIAQCVSEDLHTWRAIEPIWAPDRFITHECPDLFRWGEWWYLVYSEFSERFCTRYRIARSLQGPWLDPPDSDSIDARAFYAAKSVEWHNRRFFFGWIPTREGNRDDGAWQWAGSMSVLEAIQKKNGSLSFRIPHEIKELFDSPLSMVKFEPDMNLKRDDGMWVTMSSDELPSTCLVHIEFILHEHQPDNLAFLIRSSADGDQAYSLRLEPAYSRLVLDHWPRPTTGREQWQISGDIPHFIDSERPCDLSSGKHDIDILLDKDICLCNVDGSTTLHSRLENPMGDYFGISVTDGEATITSAKISRVRQ